MMQGKDKRALAIPTRCDCKAGDLIAGRYEVVSELGSGSFGQVFKVKDSAGTVYALKLLRLWDVPSDIREPLIERFEMEYMTGRIPSGNLVPSFDSGYLNGNPFFVMEFCPGGDISKYAGRRGFDFSRLAMDILGGLNDLHVNGKVHRDLKPENVLLRQDGTALLTDFGISGDKNHRMTERNIFGRPYQIFGTYAYMPPEQSNRARGECTVLPTTDLFSFGAVMFQMLTGSLPFGKLEDENDLAKYLMGSKAGTWDRKALASVPDGQAWMRLIEVCLEPLWKNRIKSAREAMQLVPAGRNPAVRTVARQVSAPDPEEENHAPGAFIKVMYGKEYGKEWNLEEIMKENGRDLVTVGRDFSNDIFLLDFSDSFTSRHHFTIERGRGKTWIIRDGQWDQEEKAWRPSSNGTWADSFEVSGDGLLLTGGNILSAGGTKLRFKVYK